MDQQPANPVEAEQQAAQDEFRNLGDTILSEAGSDNQEFMHTLDTVASDPLEPDPKQMLMMEGSTLGDFLMANKNKKFSVRYNQVDEDEEDDMSFERRERRRQLLDKALKTLPQFTDLVNPVAKGHNFTIRLLQLVESHVTALTDEFAATSKATKKKNGAVRKADFRKILKKYIAIGPKDETEMSWLSGLPSEQVGRHLNEVYENIDADLSEAVNFEMFLAYVIDCSLRGHVGKIEGGIGEYTATVCSYLKGVDEFSRAKYVPEINRAVTCGCNIGIINMAGSVSSTHMRYDRTTLETDKMPKVYDADFVPHLNALVLVGTELKTRVIDWQRGYTRCEIPARDTNTICTYDNTSNITFVGNRLGNIFAYKLSPNRAEAKATQLYVTKHHTDQISRIVPLESTTLATGAMDGNVVVTDAVTGHQLTKFVGHNSSITSLCYLRNVHFVCSCAYDTQPKVWMLSSLATRSDAFVLKDLDAPHVDHVVDVVWVPNTPQVASLDVTGMLKIWDIRNFQCVQTIYTDRALSGVLDKDRIAYHSLTYDTKLRELDVWSRRRVQKYEQRRLGGGTVGAAAQQVVTAHMACADDTPVTALAYNGENHTIITANEGVIKIWDAFTGRPEIFFQRFSAIAVTALTVSNSGKKFFAGFRDGTLSSHLYSTGSLLHRYCIDKGPEVMRLQYFDGMNCFLAATWEHCRVYIDHVASGAGDTPYFYPNTAASSAEHYSQVSVRSSDYSPLFNMLTIGEANGNISVWEGRKGRFTLDSVRCIGTIEAGKVEVGCVQLLQGFPVLASSDDTGRLALHTIAPHPHPHELFAQLVKKHREVLAMAFYSPKALLYAADDRGSLYAIETYPAMKTVGIYSGASSWGDIMTCTGQTGCPRPGLHPVELQPMITVRAHQDAITQMKLLPNSGTIITASADGRMVAWSLALQAKGEFNPSALERGTFLATLPRVRVEMRLEKGQVHSTARYMHVIETEEDFEAAPKYMHPATPLDRMLFAPANDDDVEVGQPLPETFFTHPSAAINNRQGKRSFILPPVKTKIARGGKKEIGGAAKMRKMFRKLDVVGSTSKEPKAKKKAKSAKESKVEIQEDELLSSAKRSDEQLVVIQEMGEEDENARGKIFSVLGHVGKSEMTPMSSNSTGVNYSTELAVTPRRGFTEKPVVIEKGGLEGGEKFRVTRAMPVFASTKEARHFHLLQLKDQEEQMLATDGGLGSTLTTDAVLHAIGRKRGHETAILHKMAATRANNKAELEKIALEEKAMEEAAKQASRPGTTATVRTATSGGLSVLPGLKPRRSTPSTFYRQQRQMHAREQSKLTRALLPHDLITLRQTQQSRRPLVSPDPMIYTCGASSLQSFMSTLPSAPPRDGGVRMDTPLGDPQIEGSGHLGGDGLGSAGMITVVETAMSPAHFGATTIGHSAPGEERLSLGVRSIPMQSLSGKGWSRNHKVELDMTEEVSNKVVFRTTMSKDGTGGIPDSTIKKLLGEQQHREKLFLTDRSSSAPTATEGSDEEEEEHEEVSSPVPQQA